MVHFAAQNTQPGSANTVADILAAAADLIEPEGRWTKGYTARTVSGRLCEATERRAHCWCGVGAVVRVASKTPGDTEAPALMALHRIAREHGFHAFGPFNDEPGRTQAEVVAALRSAADKARIASSVGTEPQSGVVNPKNPSPEKQGEGL